MLKKLLSVFALAAAGSSAHAGGLDIKLADETAELTYLTQSSTFGYGGTDMGFGLFVNEADDWQFNGEVLVTGNPAGNNKAIQFGIGGKLVFTSIDALDDEAGALAVAGQFRYVIPSSTPVAFLAAVYYAPGITTFGDPDQYTEYRFAIELEVTPSARAYIGYRNMEYDFDNGGEYELDDDPHIGVKFDF